MDKRVCAIIITYNIDNKIEEVVNSIINQVEEIVIVDNGSKKKTIDILTKLSKEKNVITIFNKSNIGIAKALNEGIKYAQERKYQWIITLDHDSVCAPNMVSNMLNIYDNCEFKEKVKILAPRVFEVNKKQFISVNKDLDKPYTIIKDCIQSGTMFNNDIFKEIGYFNEALFVYHVDYEFCERTKKAGYEIIQVNNVILEHEEGYKIPKRVLGIKTYYNNYSEMAIYYITRNTIYMCKNYSFIYAKRIIKDFIHILLFDQQRFKKLSYWNKGIRDGIHNNYGQLTI